MLAERIKGAFSFRRGVYADVEHDPAFTPTAWGLVAGASFLNQLGANIGAGILGYILGALIGTAAAVGGFALAAAVISWVGRGAFGAAVTFHELVRTLGLAYVWNAIGVLAVLGAVSPVLGAIVAPIVFAAGVAALVAWFFAAKEALDLPWGKTIGAVLLGWLALIAALIAGAILISLFVTGLGAIGGL